MFRLFYAAESTSFDLNPFWSLGAVPSSLLTQENIPMNKLNEYNGHEGRGPYILFLKKKLNSGQYFGCRNWSPSLWNVRQGLAARAPTRDQAIQVDRVS